MSNRALAAALTAFAMACQDTNESIEPVETQDPATIDDDQDGFSEEQGDCNDNNDVIFPGAREVTGDGLDRDCDEEERPASGEDRFAEALPLFDTDGDGEVSFEEFDAACSKSAQILGDANPGVAQRHVTCAGTNSCRGMVLHPWLELYQHDCRGVNGCAGWSCVETADDEGREGEEIFAEETCNFCHTGTDGAFLVHVPHGEDPEAWLGTFWARSDEQMRAAVAFGKTHIAEDGFFQSDMPGFYNTISRREIDAVLAWARALPLEAAEDH
jgi:hypothetical protein